MTTVAAKNLADQIGYGASHFKGVIARNTQKAAAFTMALLLLLALFNFTYPLLEAWFFPPPNIVKIKLAKVSLDALPPPPTDANEPPPPPPPTNVPPPSGPAARAGTPVAVPDAMLAEDLKDFANIDEIARASAIGGDGEDYGGFSDGIGEGPIVIEQREEEPDIDDFIAVEKEPGFDYEELQKRVRYPDIARRNNIEGTVLVGALIGKDGRVEKTRIISSDNELLNENAEAAVKETVFTPAIQNGNPLRMWLRIPINFRLR